MSCLGKGLAMLVSEGKNFFSEGQAYFIGDFYAGKGNGFTKHAHDHYEVIVCIAGCFEECCDGKMYRISKGQFRFVRWSEVHELKALKEKNTLRTIAIERDLFESIVQSFKRNVLNETFTHYCLTESKFIDYMKKTEVLMHDNSIRKEKMLEHIVIDLLIEVLSYKSGDQDIPFWLENAYKEMKVEENHIIGLKRFIELSGKTQEYLSRQMKRYYGQTPADYINELRLKSVVNALVTTNQRIEEIAYEYGYNNLSYFNRVFKKRYSMTPRVYREKSNYFINFEYMLKR